MTLLMMHYCMSEAGAGFGWIDNGLQREVQDILLGIQEDAELRDNTKASMWEPNTSQRS